MNYEKQFNDMVDTFTRAQQHMWKDWFDMMQNLQKRSTGSSVWQQPVEVWTDFTKRMVETRTQELVDMQTAWIGQGLNESNPWYQLPALLAEWARQSQQIAESSAEAGKQMVERWLKADGLQIWNGNWQEAINVWTESVDKLLQIQIDALKSVQESSEKLSGKQPAEREKPAHKARQASATSGEERAA